MALLATLNIGVTANVDKALKGFKRTTQRVDVMTRAVSAASSRLAAFGTSLLSSATAAVSLYSAVNAVQSSLTRLDALAKTSDKLGIASERLAGLRFAAEQTGVAVQSLDTGLQRMVRRIAEAAQGTGEAQGALEELGLNAQQLAKLSPDMQFRAIADAMLKVANQSDRVRLGFKLFDTEGVALINTLKDGSGALDDYQRQAEALGIAIGGKTLDAIESANDSINRLNKSMDGAANTVATRLSPMLSVLAKGWTDALSGGGPAGNGVDARVAELRAQADLIARFSASHALTGRDKYVDTLRAEATNLEYVTKLREKLEKLDAKSLRTRAQNVLGALSDRGTTLLDTLKKAGEEASKIWSKLRTTIDYSAISRSMEGLRDQLNRLRYSERQLIEMNLKAAGATTSEIQSQLEIYDEIQRRSRSLDLFERTRQTLEEIMSPVERLAKFIQEIDELGDRLTPEQRLKAIKQKQRDLFGASAAANVTAPAALQRGSVEARSAVISAFNQARGAQSQQELSRSQLKEAEDINAKLDEQNQVLRDIATKVGLQIAVVGL